MVLTLAKGPETSYKTQGEMLKNKFKKQQFFLIFFNFLKRDLRKFGDPEENAQNLEFRINPGKSQPCFNGNI